MVKREHRKGNDGTDARLSDDDMRAQLEFFYKFRTNTDRWHTNGIKNLKFNECECKRRKSMPQTENAKTYRDSGAQCSSMNLNTNDASTNTEDLNLQPAPQFDCSEDNDPSAKCSDDTIDRMTFSYLV